MKTYLLNFLIFTLIILSKQVVGQNFEILKSFKSPILRENVLGICAEPNGGCVLLVELKDSGIVNFSTGPDTLKFDTIQFIYSGTNDRAMFLVRINRNNRVINANYIGTFSSFKANTQYSNVINPFISRDNDGNFYITGNLEGVKVVGGKTLSSVNGKILFAKFDKNFNLSWAVQTGNSISSFPESIISSSNHVYFLCSSTDKTVIGKNSYNFTKYSSLGINLSQNRTYLYGELKPSDGTILWSKYLYLTPEKNTFELSGIIFLNNKLFISGNTFTGAIIGKDTILKGAFIAETDSVGNYKRKFNVVSKRFIAINCLTSDGEHIYLGGSFSDSVTWGKQKITPYYKTGGILLYESQEIFAASITTALSPRWFFHPKLIDTIKSNNQGGNYLSSINSSNGQLYYGGAINNSILLGSDSIIAPSQTAGVIIQPLIFKMDFLGNILWAASLGNKSGVTTGILNYVSAIADQSVYSGGWFQGKIKLGKYEDSSKKYNGYYSKDAWLTKISDYSITRGKVSSGPYCAGDTIKVPYTKKGVFDTSNYFVAELSDEYGNFETGYRELGRIKTNKDSTIIGFLPMFQVASSKLYRIRVKSTYPRVQSYYFLDSLRLLIYSRDKADPGPAETICYGTKLKLNTYGGTKWTWSPKYQMDDSTARQPIVSPTRDTIYKLIIADSSGCGEADTAFKTIFVRQKLQAFLDFKDTSLCNNQNLSISVRFVGGDSSYSWQWFFASKSWYPWNTGEKKSLDTLNYFSQADATAAEKIALVLKDGCQSKPDTAYLTISLRKKIELKEFNDTSICTGNVLNYKATAAGGIPKQYRYQWKDLVTNSVLSTMDSLKILTKKALKIQLIVNDGCEALGDTALFEVKVKAELKALTNLRDTTICSGKSLNYTAQATGGDSKAYKFYWLLNGKQINTTSSLSLSLTSALTSTLTLITTDNCSPNDTIKKTITVLPGPKADFTWDLACSRTVTKFKFTGTKPNSPITTQFNWNFNSEASSTLENPSHQFAKSGTSTSVLTLTSSNGCSDTMNKKIEVKVQAKAEFEVKDVCENQTALFTNQSQDATGYLWKFGDGQTSQTQNPKHNYTISTTTTYNVTLVAQVTNGCADSISKALTINQNPSSDFSYTYNGSKVDLKIIKSGNSYQWKFGTTDSLKTTATTYTHTIKSSDQHTVCLTATNLSGCSAQTCKNITAGILKLTEKSFKIFPNPNNGSFTIEMENPEMDAAIEVFDVMGKLVKKVERVEKVTLVNLEVASGIYVVKVKTGGAIWMKKILVSFGVDTNR